MSSVKLEVSWFHSRIQLIKYYAKYSYLKYEERRDGVGALYAYVGHMGKQYQVTPDIVSEVFLCNLSLKISHEMKNRWSSLVYLLEYFKFKWWHFSTLLKSILKVLVAPVDSVEWVLKRTGEPIPRGAISVGRDPSSGEVYHIGRSAREQHLIPGKIIHSVLYTVLHSMKFTC